MRLIFHWSEYAKPSFNGQTGYEKDGDLSHGEQQISVAEKSAENFTSRSVGDWVRRLQDDVTRGSDDKDT